MTMKQEEELLKQFRTPEILGTLVKRGVLDDEVRKN
jgi:hypothetical protein